MSIPRNYKRQQGVALFLSLIMLLVLTVLGISSFQNSHIQERAAGNARLQSVAFEAAAAGASSAINFFDENRAMGEDEICGTLNHAGWLDADGDPVATDWVEMGSVGEANLKQRMYCLADEYDDAEGGRPSRSQLFVLSRGEITSGDNVVAMRDVEVRLDLGAVGDPGDGCGAICFPGCVPGEMDFPSSNSFYVDGGPDGGHAITYNENCPAMGEAIADAIGDGRMGNYHGGVGPTGPGEPWSDPQMVEDFREAVQTQSMTEGACAAPTCFGGHHEDTGRTEYGTTDSPQVTYVHGDASFGGRISGAGIMFVNGNLNWNGTPNFEGLIVVLGGTFHIDGGGQGGDYAGSVVVLNAPGDGSFGESSFDNTGGGTGQYVFDCEALWMAHGALGAGQSVGEGEEQEYVPGAQDFWSPECDTGPATIWDAGPPELIIASWRENIGWREGCFDADAEEACE